MSRSERRRKREVRWQEHVAAEFEHYYPERLRPKAEPTYSIVVDNAEDAWALMTWALARVKTDYHYGSRFVGRYDRHVKFEEAGRVGKPEPQYRVTFPRYVWDNAKAGHSDAYAEKKVREEIFGKGK
jgi:hypothetical protein